MPMHILLVEDEPIVAFDLGMHLEAAGNEVSFAANGAEGWKLFEQVRPDVVITDLMMPVMDGSELIRRIRQISTDTPIIIMSASEDRARAIIAEVGPTHVRYLAKPVLGLDLRQGIAEALYAKNQHSKTE